MSPEQNIKNKFSPGMVDMAVQLSILAVARMIGSNRLDPASITNYEQLSSVLSKLGTTNDDAFEIHIERASIRIKSIRNCVEAGDEESAVVLLFTLIEGEINTVVQMLLRIRGFSHSVVSSTLRGTDLKTKLDVLLPLLGVDPGPRVRQLAFEAQSIRNAEVHYKARPAVLTHAGDQESDQASIKKKAVAFMARNRVDSFAVELQGFVDYCVNQCDEVQTAYELLHRFNA